MDVLITGADSDLGRTIARTFRAAGHCIVVSGAHRDEVESLAGELDAQAVVCDPVDPASLAQAQPRFPRQLDAIVSVPGTAGWIGPDTAAAWRTAFDRTVVAAVLIAQAVGDQLRSGGSIVAAVPVGGPEPEVPGVAAAVKAALTSWTAEQADHFGTRGITINTVAGGRSAKPGYDGLNSAVPSADVALARLALFLTTPAARHITGQTLHVGRPGIG
jgi:NAD(P)-dependent dehydrogenase (short-subunit alcohol dehydrogenase family)